MMPEHQIEKKTVKVGDERVHMANERTFLAWIRTCIAVMAFGFVVERFSLFVRQLSYLLARQPNPGIHLPAVAGYSVSGVLVILLVGMGTVLGVLAFIRYRQVARQIENDVYVPAGPLALLVTILVSMVGVILLLLLIKSA